MKFKILLLSAFIFISCKKESTTDKTPVALKDTVVTIEENEIINDDFDTIVISAKHKTNKILCDLDGDGKNETVEIVRSTNNDKSGLRIIFGNGNRTDYFGMGHNILGQGFDEIDWAGVFEKASFWIISLLKEILCHFNVCLILFGACWVIFYEFFHQSIGICLIGSNCTICDIISTV